MIKFDNSPASFDPPNLNFVHDYNRAVLVFDDATWEAIILDRNLAIVRSNTNKTYENFREYNQEVLLVYPNTGASAAAIDFELLIASGIRRFVAFGTCGIFDLSVAQNSIIIPTFAIREEGTSYHYLPSSKEVKFSDDLVRDICRSTEKYGIKTAVGGIWTTDVVYREAEDKIRNMKKIGCIGVDMELSALMAVAQYRKVEFAQFLIADDLIPPRLANRQAEERDPKKYVNLALDILDIL